MCTDVTDGGELNRLAGQLNLLNARLVAATEALLASGGWDTGGMRTPSHYLAWQTGISPERAKLVVRVARRRSEFPVVIAAFDRGELSLEQVAEAVRAPSWADADIAHFVRISTVTKIRRAVRSCFDDDGGSHSDPPRDRLSFGPTRDGRWRINAELGIDEGRRVEAALVERKDAMFGDGNVDVTWPEAFADCFDRSLAAVESPSRRDHYRTWIHLDVTDGTMTTTDGWRIPMPLQERILCDGSIQPVWERDGVPFSIGRTQRIVPERTRRIVERRDRGCRVPGCTADRFVEIHHIVHWLDGGATDTCNLISLCPHHHRLHHQGRLDIAGDADRFDGVTFTDATGRRLRSAGRSLAPTGPPASPGARYEPPLNGRFDWNWVGLGWIHPDEVRRRRERWRTADPPTSRSDAA